MSQNTNDQGRKPCEHGRDNYQACPHCMGIGTASQKPYHSKSEMRRVEHMKEHAQKADAPPREEPNLWLAWQIKWALEDGKVISTDAFVRESAYDAIAKELAALKEKDESDLLAGECVRLRVELEAAKTRIEKLQKHFDNCNSDKIVTLNQELASAKQEIERHISEKQQFVNQRNSAEAKLTQANARIKDLTRAGETWQGHAEANHALLMRAEERIKELEAELAQTKLTQLTCDDINEKNKARIKELEEILSGKRIADVIGENNELREREQRLVAALERIVGQVERWTDERGLKQMSECDSSIIAREALKAHRWEGVE